MRVLLITTVGIIGACFTLSSSQLSATELTGQQRAEAAGSGLIGSPGPKLVLTTIDGEQIDLGSLYGKKAIYLKFWATWCTVCREQMPHLERTYQTAGPDLAVIAIDVGFNDSREDIEAYRRKSGITMPIVLDDGRLGAAFRLRVTPQHVIIGRDGRVQYVGHLADQRLDSALLAARTETTSPSATNANRVGSLTDLRRHGVGDPLPNISAMTLDGRKFRIRDPRESRPTVLVFISPWCETYLETTRPALSRSCRSVREQVDSLAKRENEIRWLGVASGLWATKSELLAYKDQYRTQIPLTLDESGVLFRTFGIMNVPTLLIADANGRIIQHVDGFDKNLPTMLQQVSQN